MKPARYYIAKRPLGALNGLDLNWCVFLREGDLCVLSGLSLQSAEDACRHFNKRGHF